MKLSTSAALPATPPVVSPSMRVAVLCDYAEENWPSMDYYGDSLSQELAKHGIEVRQVRPQMPRVARRLPGLGKNRHSLNVDRLFGRHVHYPASLGSGMEPFDIYHIVDHSYSHLCASLPPGRTVITCHDLDAFRCLLEPEVQKRPAWFRYLTGRLRRGFEQAAHVICVSKATHSQVLENRLCPPERASVVLTGVHPSCSIEPHPAADREAGKLLPDTQAIWLLHVGSTIQRKRIDLLLRVFAAVHQRFPETRLVRVGGPFEAGQQEIARSLHIEDKIIVLPFLERNVLAAVYRKAALALLPSESEGFGLPLLEAAACGTPVVASDIRVLKEIGGPATTYCGVGDIAAWTCAISELLGERSERPDLWARRKVAASLHADQFRWAETACQTSEIYSKVIHSHKGKN